GSASRVAHFSLARRAWKLLLGPGSLDSRTFAERRPVGRSPPVACRYAVLAALYGDAALGGALAQERHDANTICDVLAPRFCADCPCQRLSHPSAGRVRAELHEGKQSFPAGVDVQVL